MSALLPPPSALAGYDARKAFPAPRVPSRYVPGQLRVTAPAGWSDADAFRPTVRARGAR